MNSYSQYLAFLRGINVGGHSLIKMADLKEIFKKIGFKNVRTILATGNVSFTSGHADKKALTEKIQSELKMVLGRDVFALLRSLDDIKKIKSSEPFKEIKVTPSMRLYVTFLSEKSRTRSVKIPYFSANKNFGIIRATPAEVFSFVDLSKGKGTTEAMAIIEKEYGSNVTTRNWNTVLKILR